MAIAFNTVFLFTAETNSAKHEKQDEPERLEMGNQEQRG